MARSVTFRNLVLDRDDYICQCCGDDASPVDSLEAHHLESYEHNVSLRDAISNGVTLCTFHHTEFHRRYGSYRNTKRQFNEYKLICLPVKEV